MFNWANMAPMSRSEIVSLLKKQPLGTRDDYVAKNELTTFICVNTWLLIIKKWSPYGALAVKRALLERGLSTVISEASDCADLIINGEELPDGLFRHIMLDINHQYTFPSTDHLIGQDFRATLLCILRYPKRYTPIDCDLLYKSSLDAFVQNDQRLREVQSREMPQWLINAMKRYICSLNWDSIKYPDKQDITLSPGICIDSNASVINKLVALSKDVPEAFSQPFGHPYVDISCKRERIYYRKSGNPVYKHVTKAIPVPKSHKASRIIFPETVAFQSDAKNLFNQILNILPEHEIPLRHQENNQQLCKISGFATIDWSKASDSIPKSLLWDLFPSRVAQLMDQLLPTHYIIDGRERLLHGLATSGNALTFILESLIFWALAKVSVDIVMYFTGTTNDIVSIYGDDVIVPDEVAETLCDLGSLLGFIPNKSKTFFGDHPYRESCGKEYYKGVDTTCVYFPRRPLLGTLKPLSLSTKVLHESYPIDHWFDTTSALIELQHALYSVCHEASVFVSEIVKDCHRNMTYSLPNTNSFDLWGYENTFVERGIPAGVIKYEKYHTPVWESRYEVKTDDLHRIAKYGMRIKATKAPDTAVKYQGLLDLYNYQHFLKYGPEYEDPLLELLGVSKRPLTLDVAYGAVTSKWSFINVL